jgi:hypothetical protein
MVSGREYFGGLLEQFVVQELRRQQTWTPIPYELFHYRQDNTHEVDIIVETDQGRLIPVEVKATSQPTSMHLRQLEALRSASVIAYPAGSSSTPASSPSGATIGSGSCRSRHYGRNGEPAPPFDGQDSSAPGMTVVTAVRLRPNPRDVGTVAFTTGG